MAFTTHEQTLHWNGSVQFMRIPRWAQRIRTREPLAATRSARMSGGGTIESRAGTGAPSPVSRAVQLAERRPGGKGSPPTASLPATPLPWAQQAAVDVVWFGHQLYPSTRSWVRIMTRAARPCNRGQSHDHDTGVAFGSEATTSARSARMVWFGATIPAEPLSLANSFHAPPSCLAYQYHFGRRGALEQQHACTTAPYQILLVWPLTRHWYIVSTGAPD